MHGVWVGVITNLYPDPTWMVGSRPNKIPSGGVMGKLHFQSGMILLEPIPDVPTFPFVHAAIFHLSCR